MAFKLSFGKAAPAPAVDDEAPAPQPGGRHRASGPRENRHVASAGHQGGGRWAMRETPGMSKGKR